VEAASTALREGEAEARSRKVELQASMERGLQELKVGKEGLEVSVSGSGSLGLVLGVRRRDCGWGMHFCLKFWLARSDAS